MKSYRSGWPACYFCNNTDADGAFFPCEHLKKRDEPTDAKKKLDRGFRCLLLEAPASIVETMVELSDAAIEAAKMEERKRVFRIIERELDVERIYDAIMESGTENV